MGRPGIQANRPAPDPQNIRQQAKGFSGELFKNSLAYHLVILYFSAARFRDKPLAPTDAFYRRLRRRGQKKIWVSGHRPAFNQIKA
jgi:hypothetical protein